MSVQKCLENYWRHQAFVKLLCRLGSRFIVGWPVFVKKSFISQTRKMLLKRIFETWVRHFSLSSLLKGWGYICTNLEHFKQITDKVNHIVYIFIRTIEPLCIDIDGIVHYIYIYIYIYILYYSLQLNRTWEQFHQDKKHLTYNRMEINL